jgi:1-acyl-sn-glycerol-3-phosphate acyltransferase
MSEPPYSVPLHRRALRWFMRPLFRGLFRLLSRVQISGWENVPRQGPYLVTINHISLFEPPFVLAFWPTTLEGVGAVEIWERPGQNLLVRLYGGIPVHRGEYDRRVVEKMISVLHSGYPLLIAPEGGRSHRLGMRRANPGAAYIAERAQVPVVPVGILGTSDDFLQRALRGERPPIEMRIGAPFCLPPIESKGEARRQARQRHADQIMLHIAALLPAEYHGDYAGQALPAAAPQAEPAAHPGPPADART